MPMGNNRKSYYLFSTKRSFDTVIRISKIVIFCLLVLVEVICAVNNRRAIVYGVHALLIVVPLEMALAVENAVKLWGLKTFRQKIVCYVLDTLLLLALTYFTDGTLISTLYIIVLSEYYLSQESFAGSIAMGVCSIVLYLAMVAVSNALNDAYVDVGTLVSNAFNDLVILVLHFLIVNFTLQIYRKNQELSDRIGELHESNEKLRQANEELKTVAALEERQRIAKDIHDTVGHSITTIIMQTEAAKLSVETDPADAKHKIAAANLQAKHALEELRESVHLLSGSAEKLSAKDALLAVIRESTDGTNVTIRCDVEDIRFGDSKRQFLINSLREGIANGLRHGNATAFYFELRREGGNAQFLLSDNGRGAPQSFSEGFGLTRMRSRAEWFGGTAAFESEPGEGFEIRISLPIDGTEEGEAAGFMETEDALAVEQAEKAESEKTDEKKTGGAE